MMILTPRDDEILHVLGTAVRALTLTQIARTWWPDATLATARARLRQLESGGYLQLEHETVSPVLALATPLTTWQPGLPLPDLGAIAATTRRRWRRPPQTILCATVTPLGAAHAGERTARTPRPTEWTHDLHLAEVYLRLRADLPTRARSWRHEDIESHRTADRAGEKLPDAVVRDGIQTTAIELVGSSYTRDKLEGFHGYCDRHAFGYDLW